MKRFFCFVFIANCLLPTADCFSQGTWVLRANLPGTARLTAVAFSIGNKGYLGTGSVGWGSSVPDFWEYDPATNAWTQKANFGGGARGFACGFSIGTKGYIGTGLNNTTYYKDFWEYDPSTNLWTQRANCPDSTRWCAVAFAVSGKGYIGLGNHTIGSWYYPQQDLREYDPVSNTWSQKANYIGVRSDMDRAVFIINNKAYCGTGGDMSITPSRNYNDFWQYDPASNSWTQKVNYPGNKRYGATGFSIFGKGYLGLGEDSLYNYYNDFYEYDPVANSWSASTAFPIARCDAPSFVIGCKAYVGTGATNSLYKDLWEFSPSGIGTLNVTASNTVICSGSTVTLSASGGNTYTWNNGSTTSSIVVTPVSSATFTVADSSSCPISGSIAISVVPQPTVTVSGNNSICLGSSATLTASGGTNYSWNTGETTTSIIISPTVSTTYSVITTAGLCADTNSISVNISSPPIANIICPNWICSGKTTILSANGGNNYSWSTGATTQSISISQLAATTYSVVVSVGACSDTANCTVLAIQSENVLAFSNVTITAGNSTTLSASGGVYSDYQWSNGANDSVIIVSPSITTTYCVTDTLSFCADTACVTVTVKPLEPIDCSFSTSDEFFIPNAFSPNGDGDNDRIKLLYGNYTCISTYSFIVYNRWGEKIFETIDPAAEWDGYYKGSIEGSAVFVYYMKATLLSGDKVVKKGNISLLR